MMDNISHPDLTRFTDLKEVVYGHLNDLSSNIDDGYRIITCWTNRRSVYGEDSFDDIVTFLLGRPKPE